MKNESSDTQKRQTQAAWGQSLEGRPCFVVMTACPHQNRDLMCQCQEVGFIRGRLGHGYRLVFSSYQWLLGPVKNGWPVCHEVTLPLVPYFTHVALPSHIQGLWSILLIFPFLHPVLFWSKVRDHETTHLALSPAFHHEVLVYLRHCSILGIPSTAKSKAVLFASCSTQP